jgi:hypothetical protein
VLSEGEEQPDPEGVRNVDEKCADRGMMKNATYEDLRRRVTSWHRAKAEAEEAGKHYRSGVSP